MCCVNPLSDLFVITMTITPEQSRMARASLRWTLDDLADASGLGRATLARFELGNAVTNETAAKIRSAFEAKRIQFVDTGPLKGAVYGGMKKA